MVTLIDYAQLVGVALILTTALTQALKQVKWVDDNFPSNIFAILVALVLAVGAYMGHILPADNIYQALTQTIFTAVLAGLGSTGLHQLVRDSLPGEKPKETQPTPTTEPTPTPSPAPGPAPADTVHIFFRDPQSMDPTKGAWKSFTTAGIPATINGDFFVGLLKGAEAVFALPVGSGAPVNPPVLTQEYGNITRVLTSVKDADGSRMDVYAK